MSVTYLHTEEGVTSAVDRATFDMLLQQFCFDFEAIRLALPDERRRGWRCWHLIGGRLEVSRKDGQRG